ncbi:MAG: hypothetical protein CK531_02940 [Gemmatimonadetes bacterium]|nr:MAG: hypothetical protein CK531_02940 [Gemmatimonadota bacterium]
MIVIRDFVAVGKRPAYGARRRPGANAKVDGVAAVPDEHAGGVLRWTSVEGVELGEAAEQCGARPLGLVELPVYDGSPRQPWRGDARLIRDA